MSGWVSLGRSAISGRRTGTSCSPPLHLRGDRLQRGRRVIMRLQVLRWTSKVELVVADRATGVLFGGASDQFKDAEMMKSEEYGYSYLVPPPSPQPRRLFCGCRRTRSPASCCPWGRRCNSIDWGCCRRPLGSSLDCWVKCSWRRCQCNQNQL